MYLNKKSDNTSNVETHTEIILNHPRVLDEIAEVTRNNNIMNATEITSFSNILSNSSNFKIIQNQKHTPSIQAADQQNTVLIKNEIDRYFSENSDDDENFFNCQVELIEDSYTHQNEEIKPHLNKDTDSMQQNQNQFIKEINEIPKIHLKTVDEINRKYILSNYIDVVKKRRQEVNRRYYLKKKQQMEKQRVATGSKTNEDKEEKEEQENKCLNANQVPLHENIIQTNNEQSPRFEQNDQQSIKTENLFHISSEPSDQSYDYICSNMSQNFELNLVETIPEFDEENLSRHQTQSTREEYLSNTKRIRSEINRRYYLKRKKKIQLEKGITDRVIIKNDAYMRRKERNRRYYLKKKDRLRRLSQEIDDSSNSQSSLQLNNYCSSFSNDIPNSSYIAETDSNTDPELKGVNDYNLDYYSYADNKTEQTIVKYENEVDMNFSKNCTDLSPNLFHNQTIEGWIEDQNRIQEEDFNYKIQHIAHEESFNGSSSKNEYLEDAVRKRQERNRRYYLKHKEKLRQQRLEKNKKYL